MAHAPSVARGTDATVALLGESPTVDRVDRILSDHLDRVTPVRCDSSDDVIDRVRAGTVHGVICTPTHYGAISEATESIDLADGRGVRSSRVPVFVADPPAATLDSLRIGVDDVVTATDDPRAVATRIETAARRFLIDRIVDEDGPDPSALVRAMPQVAIGLDRTGRVRAVTPSIGPVLGFEPAAVLDRPLARLLDPRDRDAFDRLIERLRRTESDTLESLRLRVRHAAGDRHVHAVTVRNTSRDDGPHSTVVTIGPASPWGDAEWDDDGSLQRAFEDVPEAVLLLDDGWGVRYVNAAARDRFDLSPGAADGVVFWDRTSPAIVTELWTPLTDARDTGEPVSITIHPPDRDGPLEIRGHPTDEGLLVTARTAERTDSDGPYDRIVGALEDGIALVDGDELVYANDALVDHLSAGSLDDRRLADVVDESLAGLIRERASAPVRLMDPISYRHELPDGDEMDAREFDVFVTSIDTQRTLCVFRPAGRSPRAQFDALALARSRIPDDVRSEAALRQAAVDACLAAFDLDGACWITQTEAGVQMHETAGEIDGLAADATADSEWVETAFGEGIGTAVHRETSSNDSGEPTVVDAPWIEAPDGQSVLVDRWLYVPVTDRDGLLCQPDATESVLRFTGPRLALAAFAAAVADAVDVRTARDAEAHATREGAVHERSAATHSLAMQVQREAVDGILEARTVEEIDRALCTALASIESVDLVWTGDVDLATETVHPRFVAGDHWYPGTVQPAIGGDAEPTGRAVAEGQPVVVDDVATDSVAADWTESAREAGFRSVMSVPLVHRNVVYGTVSIYSTDPGGFDRVWRTLLTSIADLAGFGLATIDLRRALAADADTTIEVVSPDPLDALGRLVWVTDVRFDLLAVVSTGNGGSVVYVRVPRLPPVSLDGLAAGIDGVDEISRTGSVPTAREGAPGVRLRIICTGETVADRLPFHGGSLRWIGPADRGTRLSLSIRPETIRRVLTALEADFGSLSLRVRRTDDDSDRHMRLGGVGLLEALTDQQVETLAAAYHGGYLEWPRERTGVEIAEMLGVSQPTFNRHYRAAERSLFDALFDE